MPKLRITKNTAIDGKPVKAGDVVDVDIETAALLAHVSVPAATSQQGGAAYSSTQVEHSDPEPESRDPRKKR
jgi:ribosomal 50S subunit-recycling heat shock protein